MRQVHKHVHEYTRKTEIRNGIFAFDRIQMQARWTGNRKFIWSGLSMHMVAI